MVIPPPERPVLRRLDVHRIEDGDNRGVVLVDGLGVVTDQTFVPEGLFPIVGRFDGVRTVTDIHRELEQEAGESLPEDLVSNLVRDFDERLLLLSPRFEAAHLAAARAFLGQPTRPARHAGSAGYPAEPDRLREALASMVRRPERAERPAPRGLVAPHIDLARGREGYAQAYGYLAESEPADLYVILGTGHQGPGGVITGLRMDWETPLGTVRTDRDYVARVDEHLGEPDPRDAFLHRAEHSIEFQVVFLSHVLGDRPFSVAGFLCGGLRGPADAMPAIEALRAAADAHPGKVCFVAGADLAHLGPFFGDPDPVDSDRLRVLADTERERLSHLEKGDRDAFLRAIEDGGNPDRVCGTTPMYLTAALAGGCAELLHYGQAPAPDGSQVVSFCSMAFA